VEVAEHFNRSPAPNEANDVCVDLGKQKGIRSCCLQAATSEKQYFQFVLNIITRQKHAKNI